MDNITLFLVVSRERYIPRLLQWIECNHHGPVTVVDSLDAQYGWPDLWTVIKRPSNSHIVDKVRDSGLYEQVQSNLVDIYSNLSNVTTDWLFILEDDVLPPEGTIRKLSFLAKDHVAIASTVVPYKHRPDKVIAGLDYRSSLHMNQLTGDIMWVKYVGFGCILLNKSALVPFHSVNFENFDVNYCKDVNSNHYQILLDSSLICQHG